MIITWLLEMPAMRSDAYNHPDDHYGCVALILIILIIAAGDAGDAVGSDDHRFSDLIIHI